MEKSLVDFSDRDLVERSIKTNWENYHYCLGRSRTVELSIGRYLTWFVTSVPDHFMNLVVCTDLPPGGIEEEIEDALAHFRSLNISRITWLAREGTLSTEVKKSLMAHGLTFNESYSRDMAADLTSLPKSLLLPPGLEIVPVETREGLKEWIHTMSLGFGISTEYEPAWYDFLTVPACDLPFRTYLACLNGKPVGTSQLFTSAGVAGIYNVTCLPEARGQGIGTAITHAPLMDACAMGYKVAILQASALGYSIYRKLAFEDFGNLSVFLWEDTTENG